MGASPPAVLAGRELVLAAAALTAIGLVAGWLSMPRPRLGELR
jgi:hypothetical protein